MTVEGTSPLQNVLSNCLLLLPEWLKNKDDWQSLIINRRKPETYRVFRYLAGGIRVCLHRFSRFYDGEAFMHPHPWQGAFYIVKGSYRMRLGYTTDLQEPEPTIISTLELTAGSSYAIDDPRTWHSVEPVTEYVYTLMVNGPPWASQLAHSQVKTTKGKDLESLTPEGLEAFLAEYSAALAERK